MPIVLLRKAGWSIRNNIALLQRSFKQTNNMKYALSLLIVLSALVACKQGAKGRDGKVYKDAKEYNDYIVNRQMIVMKNIMSIADVTDEKIDWGMQVMARTADTIDILIKDIKNMPPYGKDSAMRDAAIDLFTFYKRIFKEDYRELFEIRKNGGAATEEGMARMSEIVDKVSKEEDGLDARFETAQNAFAKANNMRLEENDLQKKIDNMDKE
jgi:hypothetical protein